MEKWSAYKLSELRDKLTWLLRSEWAGQRGQVSRAWCEVDVDWSKMKTCQTCQLSKVSWFYFKLARRTKNSKVKSNKVKQQLVSNPNALQAQLSSSESITTRRFGRDSGGDSTLRAEVSWSPYIPAGRKIGRPRNLCLQGMEIPDRQQLRICWRQLLGKDGLRFLTLTNKSWT